MINFCKKIESLIGIHIENKIIIGLFVFMIPVSVFLITQGFHLITRNLVAKEIPMIKQDFNHEMDVSLSQTKAAVSEHTIDKYIDNNDFLNTSKILSELAKKYGFSGMVAVNKEGVVLARLASPRIGDYVFQTTSWGRSAAQGKSISIVGEGRNFPLLINSAVPIIKNQEVQGALFGAYILNDEYASDFKEKYLKSGDEIIFYSNKTGIFGTSFKDPETRHLLEIYINQGSDLVQQKTSGLSENYIKIGNTTFYILNIKLDDTNGSVGGMIILIPINTSPRYVITVLTGILLLFLIIQIRRRKYKSNTKNFIITTIILCISISVSVLIFVWIANQQIFKLILPTETIYNSTISFAPESDLFQLNIEQQIAIKITTGGESINSAQAIVQFDPKFIQVNDILLTNSFCDQNFILDKEIDNKNGTITIACSKTNGFVGNSAILAELLIQPLKAGNTDLQFSPETEVLANDGLGTNVLRTSTNGSYQIFTPDTKKQKDQILLFSYSHPNQARWYNKKDIHLDWVRPDSYKDYIYTFDQNPNTIPNGKLSTIKTDIDLNVDRDGIYYFHIAPRKQGHIGQTSHYKTMIDITPPEIPEIKSSITTAQSGELVRFEFINKGDKSSGLQKNFYIKFDDGVWLPTLPQLYMPFLAGKHTLKLRVFDNAGNFSDTNTEISVR